MKKKNVVYLLILSFIFNFAFLGSLGYRMIQKKKWQKARAERAERGRKSFNEWLELTEDQIAKLEEIREKYPSRIRSLRTQMHEERKKLGPMLRHASPDTIKIMAHLQSINQMQVKIEKSIIQQVLREKTVLTPEQSKKYLKMVERHLGGSSFRRRNSSRRGDSDRRPDGRRDGDRNGKTAKDKPKGEWP
ncbi:Spy/CpxP family protein refolding chaperone [bacterium]